MARREGYFMPESRPQRWIDCYVAGKIYLDSIEQRGGTMKKAIRDDKICFIFESLQEARDWLTALTNVVPFYTSIDGSTYEIKNLKDVSITLLASADIREMKNN